MDSHFDPYWTWLKIPPAEQPPNHYRLLDLPCFESDSELISAAADRQMLRIKSLQTSRYVNATQDLLNKFAAAKVCLLNPVKKAAYDARLRQQLTTATPAEAFQPPAAVAQTAARPMNPSGSTIVPPKALESPSTSQQEVIQVTRGLNRRLKSSLLAVAIAAIVVSAAAVGFLFRTGQQPEVARATIEPPSASPQASEGVVTPASPEITAESKPAAIYPKTEAPPPAALPKETDVATTVIAIDPSMPEKVEPPSSVAAVPSAPPDQVAPPERPAQTVDDLKPPLPAPADRDEALKRIQEVYKEAFNADGDPKVAAEFLNIAQGENHLPTKFVLLKLACDQASAKGNCELAMQAVDRICANFACDEVIVKAKVLASVAGKASTVEQSSSIAQHAMAILPKLLRLDQPELASQTALYAVRFARLARNEAMIEQAIRAAGAAIELIDERAKVTAAQKVLADKAMDPAANECVGRYKCLQDDNWAEGLPHLSKSSDVSLQEVARMESANPQSADARIALADLWWVLAEKAPDFWQARFLARAKHWYQLALPDSVGLRRTKASSRLAEANEIQSAFDAAALVRAERQFPGGGGAKSDEMIVQAINMARGGDIEKSAAQLLTAARQDPERAQADFVLATIYLLSAKNAQSANRHYEACMRKDRDNSAVLNNLAVTEMRLGQYADAIRHWRTALSAASPTGELVANVERIIQVCDNKQIPTTGSSISGLRKDYETLRDSGQLPRRDYGKGWRVIIPTADRDAIDSLLSTVVATALSEAFYNPTDNCCLACRGLGQMSCPVRGCSRGGISQTIREVVAQNSSNGDTLYRTKKIRVPCRNCDGRGTIECPTCHGDGEN